MKREQYTSKREIKNNTNGMREEMKTMRGEMRQVGQCLQAGKMTPPRAATNGLEGSAPSGEDRVSRETCWARRVEVTETVTRTLKGGRDHEHERDKTRGYRADGDAGDYAGNGRGETTRGRGNRRTHAHTHR